MRIIGLSRHYQKKPSEILEIDDGYTAFCLDEACALIVSRMTGEGAEKPVFEKAAAKEDLIAFLRNY